MNNILKLINENDILPIPIEIIKNFLKIDFDDDNELLKNLTKTAIRCCETYINKTIIEKTYTFSVYKNSALINLPYPPVKNINNISIISENKTSQLLNFCYDDMGNILKLNVDNFYRIDINYTAGMINLRDDLIQGILMHIAVMYEDRNGYSPMPLNSMQIYNNYKEIRI